MSSWIGIPDHESELTEKIAMAFRDKLAKEFGITMHRDNTGAFGKGAGTIWCTLRTTFPDIGRAHITMIVHEINEGL